MQNSAMQCSPATQSSPATQWGQAPALAGSVTVLAGPSCLQLLAEKAAFEGPSRSLFVADLHLGKAASFRALGVPVPSGTTERTLSRLSALIACSGARRLYLLGDLFHARPALAEARVAGLARWRAQHAGLEVFLVRGNHDDRAGLVPPQCGIEVLDPGARLADLRLHHEPPASAQQGFWLAGHLHPVARVGGRADALRMPCFWAQAGGLVLPAFGDFTGGWLVRPGPGECLYLTDGQRVHPLPARPVRGTDRVDRRRSASARGTGAST